MLGAFILSMALVSEHPEPLQIRASLSGYNLIAPSNRCCAFDVELESNGVLEVTIHQSSGGHRVLRRHLTPQAMSALKQTIDKARFFSLPETVGALPVDGDKRRMIIHLGARKNDVELGEWNENPQTAGKQLELTRRAHLVWKAVRALADDPEITVP